LLRVAQVRQAKLPAEHPYHANTFHSLACLRERQGKTTEAEACYQKALHLRDAALPPDHPYRAKLLEDYARLLQAQGRDQEAAELGARAQAAREQHAAVESAEQSHPYNWQLREASKR
jgi:tetratricopeptide (TPR) repeat protein